MRKIYIFVALCLLTVSVYSQQKPQYTQYVFNNYLLNPAVSGIENYLDVKAGYRRQWTGLDGAPVTTYLTANMPIGAKFIDGDATAMPAAGGTNPLSRSYTQEYMAAEPHHGVGLMVVGDRTGPITQTTINATYAYHLGLAPKLNLAVGVSAGINNIGLDRSKIQLGDFADDPAIANSNVSQIKPDLGMGVWLYSADYYVGASAQQLLKQNLYFSTNGAYNQSQTVPHFFFTAGVKLYVTDDITFMPSVLVKVINPVPTTFDINGKLAFRDRFWIGAAYRRNDAVAAIAGINISSLINVGYSYDFTTSALRTVSNGTHEIVIGLLLNNRYKVTCPMRTF
ncbi:type IX secretion system membrane protein PorP/SprF [Mucilaginibacter sp. RS28]|uniref:Type IX secretion system membrane protein PorP/SprF n=1 Tax=Mucilaginibacter straminoryzae TaxID=2932774 RepID=A0A9X2B7Z8_9SPHI|nr:type IX secretion system membrane protein PorP/SprF [Mucilaginibacter straminoryzae]MCJ8208936.1 type IX secretion system membrane protein PorP/SprF [Mucilaginibacter straminoryzae]